MINVSSCSSQDLGPGYRFELFINTKNWELAQSVKEENENAIRSILKQGNVDVNLQEPKFGVTLLHLAIGNGKLHSTNLLLKEGAKMNIADFQGNLAIHEASKFVKLRKNALEILKTLVESGADVNAPIIRKAGTDTINYFVPLIGASKDFECAKFLLERGADVYLKYDSNYVVWNEILSDDLNDGIFVAKYMIVDKKMRVPDPISYSLPNKIRLDIYYFLNKENFRGNHEKEIAKKAILDYLKLANFPQNGKYMKSQP
jgi:hypothetical protein